MLGNDCKSLQIRHQSAARDSKEIVTVKRQESGLNTQLGKRRTLES